MQPAWRGAAGVRRLRQGSGRQALVIPGPVRKGVGWPVIVAAIDRGDDDADSTAGRDGAEVDVVGDAR